ncbi:ABC-type transport auxiliary lipoprotein family protein [Amorphus orientalis]|uniref:Cholesterol transport system auxiliary component n=1 Tax=Amorphus orientalis TaxID=649198 RepID=A0AAE4ATM8_9HYPH|nr:ABC-type transport auxiliary lipoprotein family protein [Amorphus orientalis]MDQ0316350.1 cholesterol transport system auxiliary component [Amorphus orientalis]
MPARRPGLRVFLAPLLAAGLSACAALGGGGPSVEAIYTLDAPREISDLRGRVNSQLLVATPVALDALDTNMIAVRPTPSTLSYYPSVQWADRLPVVFQAVLAEALQNTNRVRAVGLPGQSLLINYQIVTEIRAFQAETTGSDRAAVTVSAKILDDRNGRVVASRIFTAEQPTSGDSVQAAVGGLDRANQQVVSDMVRWIVATVR